METYCTAQLVGIYKIEENCNVHLLELIINVAPIDLNVSLFTQCNEELPRDSWQTAYDEHFLNEDGTKVIGSFIDQDNLKGTKTRIAFFMYFIDFNKPLQSQFGEIKLIAPSDMPLRLSKIIEFEFID